MDPGYTGKYSSVAVIAPKRKKLKGFIRAVAVSKTDTRQVVATLTKSVLFVAFR